MRSIIKEYTFPQEKYTLGSIMTEITKKEIKSLVNSDEQFPVNFDDAWQWLEYSTKGNGKKAFLDCGFAKEIDFLINHKPTTTGIQAHPEEIITMTVDCFKNWAMMSRTETGRQVRLYFIECEKIAKETKQLFDRHLFLRPTTWEKRYDDRFYSELSRLTGYEWKPGQKEKSPAWGKITKELIYDHLPEGFYEELKRRQLQRASFAKLHQFFQEEAIEELKHQIKFVTELMEGASSLSEVTKILNQKQTKHYQQSLFDQN